MNTKKIGAFIAMNRKKKGYTQEQLAEKLGVTNKTISRWENGHYMPDLSLLEPLSKELDITINELLAGEEIIKEEAIEYSEQNLIQTIDYTDKKIKNEHKKISLFIIGLGICTSLCAFTVFPSESSWGSIYSMIGLFFFVFDYASVSQFKQPPIYRLTTTTVFSDDGNKMIEYQNPFYNVFRINADTPNEYYLIDNKKQYTIDTVPTSPFNVDKSSFEQLKKYKSKYIGDNSNTSHLLNALPLSEYGYVFEIDSENYGLTINYNCTDWYNNENLYIHKALVYNSVSLFKWIDNLEYITFNFSGSSYTMTREHCPLNKNIEQKINDNEFVSDRMKLFETN